MENLLKNAKNSQKELLNLTPKAKESLILTIANEINLAKDEILKANTLDIKNASNLPLAMLDRLRLNDKKIESIIASLKSTATIKDPVGKILDGWVNKDGLKFEKVAIPLGVVCVIYESRPNATTEVAGLCLKSANACVLKGGSEAKNSNLALVSCIHRALDKFGISKSVVTYLENFSREDTTKLIKMDKFIDVIIPRGGASLVKFISEFSLIPVIKHDKGMCHIFVDESADTNSALEICINAKVQNPSACNAVETILVHESLSEKFLPRLGGELSKLGVKINGCEKTAQILGCEVASDESWDSEYLGLEVNIALISSLSKAISHIKTHSSDHSEAIISQNYQNIEIFLNSLDSSCLYANASTRFSDGYEFGFGGEVGISTNRLHARGPMGVDGLMTYKYKIYGNGQVRE